MVAARDGGTGHSGEGSGESSQAGSSKSGGGPQAAWFAVLAGGLKQPLREAPPLRVAADSSEKRLPLRAALKRQGALVRATDNEWRAKRGSSRSEQGADRLAVGAHPRPLPGGPRLQVCTGRRPLPLGWPPTRASLTLLRVRSPSGSSIRQGARRQCAGGQPVCSLACLPPRARGAVLSMSVRPLPRPHAVVPSLPYPEWQDESCGSSQRLCGDASSPRNPDSWTQKEKKETEHGWSCGQGFPGRGV